MPRTGHNHFTRDIKPEGQCPACDQYHQQERKITPTKKENPHGKQ